MGKDQHESSRILNGNKYVFAKIIQEHLDKLLLGVATWNDWKKQNPAIFIYPNLSDANLHGADLHDATLSRANLGKANLLGAWAGHSFVICAEPDGECGLLTITLN